VCWLNDAFVMFFSMYFLLKSLMIGSSSAKTRSCVVVKQIALSIKGCIGLNNNRFWSCTVNKTVSLRLNTFIYICVFALPAATLFYFSQFFFGFGIFRWSPVTLSFDTTELVTTLANKQQMKQHTEAEPSPHGHDGVVNILF